MLSNRGIYYDLNESTYSFKYGDLDFVFSSQFYLTKFKTVYKDCLKNETLKLNSKYKCIGSFDIMILLNLYKMIEKRGFKVLLNNKDIPENYYFKLSLFNKG